MDISRMFISFCLTLKVKSFASAPHHQHGEALGEVKGGGGLLLLQSAALLEGLAAGGHFCAARGGVDWRVRSQSFSQSLRLHKLTHMKTAAKRSQSSVSTCKSIHPSIHQSMFVFTAR